MTNKKKQLKSAHSDEKSREKMIETLEKGLIEQFGPLLSGERLSQALGYPSMNAFRQALVRGTVPVPVFTPKHRRGKYALVKDVATWLAEQRDGAVSD